MTGWALAIPSKNEIFSRTFRPTQSCSEFSSADADVCPEFGLGRGATRLVEQNVNENIRDEMIFSSRPACASEAIRDESQAVTFVMA